jgi:ubiquinone/menaquinone biosynthesis C-methylase UbiE
MNRMNGKQYQAVLDNANIQSTDTVLDIGFGNGYLIKKLSKCHPKQICGVEISQDMLSRVTKKNRQRISDGNLDLRLADVQKLPFDSAMFDKVCTVNTFYFWKDVDSCFSEIKRTLKSDGVFINAVYTKEWLDNWIYTRYGFSKYSVEQITEITEKNGLKVVTVIEIQAKKSLCIISKK